MSLTLFAFGEKIVKKKTFEIRLLAYPNRLAIKFQADQEKHLQDHIYIRERQSDIEIWRLREEKVIFGLSITDSSKDFHLPDCGDDIVESIFFRMLSNEWAPK